MKAIKKIGFVLISLIALAFVVAPLFAVANSNNSSPTYNVNDKEQKFVCEAFTRNTIDADGKLTDNDPKYVKTTVLENKEGFTIKAGDAFKEKVVLGNGMIGPGSNMGSNSRSILQKRNEIPGALYFMIYTFDNEKDPKDRVDPADSPIKDMVVLGQCKRKQ
jgi:hypothetical protein